MLKQFIPVLLTVITINVYGQKTENNFNAGFELAGNLGDSEEAMGSLYIGHEWRFFPFLGAELNATLGSLNYNSKSIALNPETHTYSGYDYSSIDCRYNTLSTKLNGYLNLLYAEDDQLEGFLFASLSFGLATLKAKGKLETYEKEKQKASTNYNPHFYTGLEIGLGIVLSNKFLMKLSLGGSSIKFDEAADKLNNKIDENFPLKFTRNINEPFYRVGFTYLLKYRKEK